MMQTVENSKEVAQFDGDGVETEQGEAALIVEQVGEV